MHKGISNTATEIALLHIKAQNYKKKTIGCRYPPFFLVSLYSASQLWYGVLANICTLRHLNTAAKYDI